MRVFHFIVRNAPLKVGALVLAVILYVAMVALQNTAQWPGTVAIDVVNQPTTGYLITPVVTDLIVDKIRYIAPPDVRVSQSSFRASIDLANVKPSETDTALVRVQLKAEDPRIQIIDYQPQQLTVQLNPIVSKTVPVVVYKANVPTGLTPGTPVLSFNSVKVTGPSRFVQQVAYARAPVRIDSSGLDVSEDVDLVAMTSEDVQVDKVSFNPRQVNVKIQVVSQSRSETVPINPPTVGTPASGYYVASVDVQPPVVLVRGQADALARLAGKASTKAISISGATGDVTAQVDLDLPDGVTADLSTTVTVVVHLRSDPISRSVTIGVAPAGAHSNLVYTLSTPSVVVTLGGATASLNAFDTSTLVGTVFVGDLGVGVHTLSVSVSVPPGIRVVAINPAQVTVTILAAPTPIPSASPGP